MTTFHIHIKGSVQGVGFRPYVYKLAKQFQLKGWVNNTLDGVHVEFNAPEQTAKSFCDVLIANAPALSVITGYELTEVSPFDYSDFKIIHSDHEGQANLMLSPDFGICDDCLEDIKQTGNRREAYAFTTCTNCGPRYSITERLPYDRETTTMEAFEMCPICQKEYDDPEDRRYYSQTNSCPDCRISLGLYNQNQAKQELGQEAIIDEVVKLWKLGKIIAIKGIGGYLLTCDATNEEAVRTLRKRKKRPSKPFALMFPNLEQLDKTVELCEEEIVALTSPVAPIVLLRRKDNSESELAFNEIAPGLGQLGVMLPYAPLYQLLLQKFQTPAIATSANITNAPIIYQDGKALAELTDITDYILMNDRTISIAQDDSVLKFSPLSKQQLVIRRSRGIAPSYFNKQIDFPKERLLATGADMKSTFALNHLQNCYVSQYIGDLESFETQESYKSMLAHFLELFKCQPELVLTDKHPNYFSSRLGSQLAEKFGTIVIPFQHHIAHFGAVLGENNLIDVDDPVLGVVWDGTGYGDDGHIWGGEFFKYQDYSFERISHFKYFPFIAGNKMPREPRISALAVCSTIPEALPFLENKFSKTEWNVYQALLKKASALKTSSLGRIFDAVASLLGLIDQSSYEGEAAMLLEKLAWEYVDEHGLDFEESYYNELFQTKLVSTESLIKGILSDLSDGTRKAKIAAKFLFSLVQIIKQVADYFKLKKIACSGGVFQNSLLIDLILHHLKKDYKLYFHQALSPNDENISFGQLVCYHIQNLKQNNILKPNHHITIHQ